MQIFRSRTTNSDEVIAANVRRAASQYNDAVTEALNAGLVVFAEAHSRYGASYEMISAMKIKVSRIVRTSSLIL